MKINFTKKQYLQLLKIAFLGEFIVNGSKIGEDERDQEIQDIASFIYSHAKDFGYEKYVKEYSDSHEIAPPYDQELYEYIHEYCEDEFWEMLIDRLARKNFIKQYGIDAINNMTTEERMEKEQPFMDKYYEEISINGLRNIDIR